MKTNDILRRLRYALSINDAAMIDIFKETGYSIDFKTLFVFLKREDEEGYIECPNEVLEYFLDGLIISRRGRQENRKAAPPTLPLTNNSTLKKIRIALELREEHMLEIFSLAGMTVSKHELSALFRRKEHKHYKPCGDQMLRYFLKGLTIKLRGDKT